MRSLVPGTAAARSSYRPAAKAPRRTAELLPLQSRAVRVAVDGSLPPARILRKTMSSTAGNDTAKDSMDEIKAVPEQRSQGTSSPSLLGSYFEAGDEDQGEQLGTTHSASSLWGTSWVWGCCAPHFRSTWPRQNRCQLHKFAASLLPRS